MPIKGKILSPVEDSKAYFIQGDYYNGVLQEGTEIGLKYEYDKEK